MLLFSFLINSAVPSLILKTMFHTHFTEICILIDLHNSLYIKITFKIAKFYPELLNAISYLALKSRSVW